MSVKADYNCCIKINAWCIIFEFELSTSAIKIMIFKMFKTHHIATKNEPTKKDKYFVITFLHYYKSI